ncbi:MAG: hypothetical protein DCF13_09050 [Flavobacteriaceae bacterium]|nr:MAG: hypothetical protein DCF13_09050 [Flavobacteriaceae bacterium]
MIQTIDKIGVFNIVLGFVLILVIFFFTLKIFRFYFFKSEESYNKFETKSFMSLSILLIALLFLYSSYSKIILNFNPNKLSESEQIQSLKSHINYIESRNNNFIKSILLILSIMFVKYNYNSKNKKQE